MSSNYYSGMIFSDLIKAELDKVSDVQKKGEKYTMILCPYHQEKTPSARVWYDNGNFSCFGCGRKERWNDLAARLNLKQFGKDAVKLESLAVPTTDFDRYDNLVAMKKDQEENLSLYEPTMEAAVEYAKLQSGKWRGFRLDFLEDVGVKIALSQDTGRYYMYLPIQVKGKLKGYIKGQIVKPRSKKIPSYINSKGSWSRNYGLFPYDYAVKVMKAGGWATLVLVEGPRDALRLLKFGIPAICIMGTHSWSQKKMQLLEFSGATRIVLMLDGDAAGKACTRLIKTGINSSKEKVADPLDSLFEVKVVKLWNADVPEDFGDKGYDPGNCPPEILVKVKKLIK